jgi:hypothetical protein
MGFILDAVWKNPHLRVGALQMSKWLQSWTRKARMRMARKNDKPNQIRTAHKLISCDALRDWRQVMSFTTLRTWRGQPSCFSLGVVWGPYRYFCLFKTKRHIHTHTHTHTHRGWKEICTSWLHSLIPWYKTTYVLKCLVLDKHVTVKWSKLSGNQSILPHSYIRIFKQPR